MYCKHLEVSHVIAHTKAQLSDFKLGQKLSQLMSYDIFQIVNPKIKKFRI